RRSRIWTTTSEIGAPGDVTNICPHVTKRQGGAEIQVAEVTLLKSTRSHEQQLVCCICFLSLQPYSHEAFSSV
ncbi:hypothetical protein BaRGS_00027445, partial [Batillaria attramentaria]